LLQTGIILTVALGMCSLISMGMAVLGSFVGLLTGMFFGAPKHDIIMGVWGYNSALAGIAVRALRTQHQPRVPMLFVYTEGFIP
jgi:urea transporter